MHSFPQEREETIRPTKRHTTSAFPNGPSVFPFLAQPHTPDPAAGRRVQSVHPAAGRRVQSDARTRPLPRLTCWPSSLSPRDGGGRPPSTSSTRRRARPSPPPEDSGRSSPHRAARSCDGDPW
ncbi:hypothetical protein EJB05_03266, partial [Eragrostis curvula]